MSNFVHLYVGQRPEDILSQLETNLRDAREVKLTQQVARIWKEDLATRSFSKLVEIINKDIRGMLAEELTAEDLEGGKVYFSEEEKAAYELKHQLPALSFGIAIPAEKWSGIQRKLRMRRTSTGVSLTEYGFSQDSLGLNRTGLTMHSEDENTSYREYEQLYEDQGLYSRKFLENTTFTLRKLASEWELSMALLCRMKRDICAERYEKEPAKMAEGLVWSLDVYKQAYENALMGQGANVRDIGQFRQLYEGVVLAILPDINPAIEAAYALEERVGAGVVTPLLFSLGTIDKHELGSHFRSPLKGIIKAREYFESGELRTEDITQILERKGYKQMASA